MNRSKLLIFMGMVLTVVAVAWSFEPALAKNNDNVNNNTLKYHGKVTPSERKAAADRAAAAGFALPVMGEAVMAMPGDVPHYFSHPNYANSPLPGNIVSEWNAIAQDIVQPTPMPGMPMSGVSMATAFVYLSYI